MRTRADMDARVGRTAGLEHRNNLNLWVAPLLVQRPLLCALVSYSIQTTGTTKLKLHPLNNDGSCPTMRSTRRHHDVHHYFHFRYFHYFRRNREIHNLYMYRSRSRRRPSLAA